MTHMDDICHVKGVLIDALKDAVSCGVDKLDTQETGCVIDMIKDLCECEEEHYEALYYKSLVGAQMKSQYDHDFTKFRNAKMCYDTTHSEEDRRSMNDYADEYIRDSIKSFYEIWGSVDQDFRMKMKDHFSKFMSDMNA